MGRPDRLQLPELSLEEAGPRDSEGHGDFCDWGLSGTNWKHTQPRLCDSAWDSGDWRWKMEDGLRKTLTEFPINSGRHRLKLGLSVI